MTRFLLTFLSVYSLIHAIFFLRLRVLLVGRAFSQAVALCFFLLMILAPIGVRLLERSGHEVLARYAAWIAYPWMGFIFLSFMAFLLAGVFSLLSRLINALLHTHIPTLAGPGATLAIIGIVLAVCVYGYFEARDIRIERITIKTAKLPENVERVKIAQISDVHLGLLVRAKRLKSIVEKIQSENPDILVSTGDLVDGTFHKADKINGLMLQLRPPLGKYAVTGNHEYYAGLDDSIEFTRGMGFKMLRGETETLADTLNIAGVDDPVAGMGAEENRLLSSSSQNGLFTLFLKHRPEVKESSKGLFDLQLSGHTHRGQIFPFRLIVKRVYPMLDGRYDVGKGSTLYTSRGTGTWGPPMRVLAPPEVTIIELVREKRVETTNPQGNHS